MVDSQEPSLIFDYQKQLSFPGCLRFSGAWSEKYGGKTNVLYAFLNYYGDV